jgi:serine/threonine protein kinase
VRSDGIDELLKTLGVEEEIQRDALKKSHGAVFTNFFEDAIAIPCEKIHESRYKEAAKDLHVGDLRGDFVGKSLGEGAMGVVYKFRNYDGMEYAAKAVNDSWEGSDRNVYEAVLMREAAICFSLGRSPFIASVRNVAVPSPIGSAAGTLLICDLGDKGTLKCMMGRDDTPYRGPLYGVEESKIWPLRNITLQIFLGLDHMHSRGVVHQDFTSSNIMLRGNGVIKIAGFGACLFAHASTSSC